MDLDRRDVAAEAPVPLLQRVLHRPVVAAVVLFAVYLGLSSLNDEAGYLGTDTGGKVATVKVMAERGDLDPDVGYWAAPWDPQARVHGLYYTSVIGDRYVNVTSLPMVLVATPLWELGGYRATLLLPMAGAVAAAFAARAIARRTGGGDGWSAFWITGLASPLVVYALDLWEHSAGAALMAWGAVALVDAVEERPTWWRGLAAGVAFGAAAAMRTEAFAYVVAMTAVTCVALAVGRRRDLPGAVAVGASAVAGFVGMFAANLALEVLVLGEPMRAGRASGAAGAGLTDLGVRVREGLVTTLSPFPTMDPQAWVVGACLLGALLYTAVQATRPGRERLAVAGASVAGVVYLWRFGEGPGFVPGLVAATPFAAVALALGWRDPRTRLVLLLALVPLPVVVAFQFTGGAAPQWAGRYLLTSGLLLGAVGVAQAHRMARWARVGFLVAAVAVTALGVAWLSVRSHGIADAARRFEARPEAVLISPNGFIPREFGASYPGRRWLAAGSVDDLRFAVDVVGASGADSFALVDLDTVSDPPTFPGWRVVSSELEPFLPGVDVRVTSYVRHG